MKRSIKSLILLAVLAIFVGGYLLAGQMSKTEQVSEERGSFALTAKTAADLTGLAWTKDETNYHFTKAEDTWANADEPAFPVDQDAVQGLADDLAELTATRRLEDVTELANYGLAEPVFSVTATWSDGSQTTYAMGDETPFDDGYYLSTGESGVVYTVENSLSAAFNKTMTDLAKMEDIPGAETVTRITVGSALDAAWQEISLTINENQHWYDAAGQPLDGVDDLVTAAQDVEWDALVQPVASPEELNAWQVDDASATVIALYNGEEAARTLLIGGTNDSGDYYARLPGSSMVYTVTADSVSSLLAASNESLLSMALVETGYEQVASAAFTAGEVTYAFQAKAEEVAAAADAESAEAEDPNEALWSALTAITASGALVESSTGDVLLTVEVTAASGASTVLTFYEHDVDSYAATMDTRAVLVSADKVDKLIRLLKSMQ